MTTTSKAESYGKGGVKFSLPLTPIPAPRPRIRVLRLKSGKTMGNAYYTGKYKVFLVEAPKAIPESPVFFEKGIPVAVNVQFYLPKPAKPANPYPVGDIDNLLKSILDAITKNGTYWHDDAQVMWLSTFKIYTEGQPRITVQMNSSSMGLYYETEDGGTELL